MPFLSGHIVDEHTGAPLMAKAHVLGAGGRPAFPAGAVQKVGPGLAGFYAEGEFLVEVPGGLTTILVERGTEYEPCEITTYVHEGLPADLLLSLRRWTDLPQLGWYPGNTHIHYDEHETAPDRRLRLDPGVHDLRVTVVSILQRQDLPYAVNRYPVGLLTDFCTAHHVVDCGEENRHNQAPWEIGYGHVLFLRIAEPVLPISRGVLVSEADPDYPPLCYACDDARRQGGVTIWCHNGQGMEAPVAAALGKLDAFNLFDPSWDVSGEYTTWYHLLNCGLRLPASTGSDWYICSNNRVYVQLEGAFSYDAWLQGLKAGRTFITNGPALFLHAADCGPGETLAVAPGQPVEIEIAWQSHHPLNCVEAVFNGEVIDTQTYAEGSRSGSWRFSLVAQADGWLAARAIGNRRDSFQQAVYAHTSPVWVKAGLPARARTQSAAFLARQIDTALAWVQRSGRYASEVQQREVRDLFRAGQNVYHRLSQADGERDAA